MLLRRPLAGIPEPRNQKNRRCNSCPGKPIIIAQIRSSTRTDIRLKMGFPKKPYRWPSTRQNLRRNVTFGDGFGKPRPETTFPFWARAF